MNFLKDVGIREVKTRPVKARAMQFKYRESRDETIRYVRALEASLDVWVSCASDQGASFYHVELDGVRSQILKDGDWVLVDAFKKVSIVSAEDFKVYYEPE